MPGYITEKIMNPFLAGAIPIYHGDDWARALFAHDAVVWVNRSNPSAAIDHSA